MKRISIRVLAALLTFVIGVTATALWFFYFRLQPQNDISHDSVISPIDVEDSEKYAIYSRVLADERYINGRVKSVIIEEQTTGYPSAAEKERFSRIESYIKEMMPELSQTTFTDYLAKNLESQPLKNRFDLKAAVVLISQKEVESGFKEHSLNGWEVILERYPDSQGLITLSAVGFNPDMTQAVVHVGIGCGGKCGEGNLFLLHKENGDWQLQKKITTWVS